MEEKKTKKMTKAEAFEWLKGKKVLCKVYDYDKMEAVQGFVKSLGFHWSDYSERFEEHEYEEISVDDILSIEIVEEKNEPLDKWDEFARCVAKVQEKIEEDEVCIITKGNFLTMTK